MAEGNSPDYLRGEVAWLENPLCALRPICTCRQSERSPGPVPMEFPKLANKTIDDVTHRFAISDLAPAKNEPRPVTELEAFLRTTLLKAA